jgi:hypothetical protein
MLCGFLCMPWHGYPYYGPWEDKEVFSTLLTSMVRSPVVASTPQPQVVQQSQDPDTMEIVPATIKKGLASK